MPQWLDAMIAGALAGGDVPHDPAPFGWEADDDARQDAALSPGS
jgi:hypothetical protein